MQFNSEANGLDLYSDARYLCGLDETSDTTSYPIKAFTRNANLALDRITSLIFKADNRWEFDDSNNSDGPIATTNLVANQQDYGLVVTQLKIRRVRVKDQQGNWIVLNPVSRRNLNDTQLTQTAGTPNSYDPLGNSLFLYPSSSYDSTDGLELQFQRSLTYFAYTDTTKVPGFASQFHRLISLHAALEYCEMNGLNVRAASIRLKIGSPPDVMNNEPGSGLEKELMDFYSARNADEQPTISVQRNDYGELGLSNGTAANPYGF